MNKNYGYTICENGSSKSLQCECGWVSPAMNTNNQVETLWAIHLRKHHAIDALKRISLTKRK